MVASLAGLPVATDPPACSSVATALHDGPPPEVAPSGSPSYYLFGCGPYYFLLFWPIFYLLLVDSCSGRCCVASSYWSEYFVFYCLTSSSLLIFPSGCPSVAFLVFSLSLLLSPLARL